MIADNVEVIFIDDIRDFVELHGGLLRVDFSFPRNENYDDALASGVDDAGNRSVVVRGSKKLGDVLKGEKLGLIQGWCWF